MEKMMFIATMMVWWLSALVAGQPSTPPLAPMYACDGMGPEAPYALDLKIEPFDENYILTWIDGRRPVMQGLAVREGDRLAVALTGSRAVGVAIYRIVGPTLVGTWSPGDGHRYTETCQRGAVAERKRA
jgi:hypothetical protein